MSAELTSPNYADAQTAGGLAGWLLNAARLLWSRSTRLRTAERELEILETLALGGQKQLLLVLCGGEKFLVGTGAAGVQTIVQIARAEAASELDASPLLPALAPAGAAR